MFNNIILDSIPGSSGGLRKTYEESLLFYDVDYSLIYNVLQNGVNRKKLYISNKGKLYTENNISDFSDFREVEIISFYPYRVSERNNHYAIEVIDKEILHEHLTNEFNYKMSLIKSEISPKTKKYRLKRNLTK